MQYIWPLATPWFCQASKATTICNYLCDIAQFLARFLNANIQKIDATQARLAPVIQFLIDEVTGWEKVPDKHEPFTPAIWEHMDADTGQAKDTYSVGPSLCNWFVCGLFGAF
jgi:hypothetical protein